MDTNRFTELTDEQIMVLSGFVRTYLSGLSKSDIIDIEQDFKDMNIRLYVDFTINLDSIELKAAEIQDLDYQITKSRDSKVLEWILQDEVIPEYNKEYNELYNQALDIAKDQREGLLNPYTL